MSVPPRSLTIVDSAPSNANSMSLTSSRVPVDDVLRTLNGPSDWSDAIADVDGAQLVLAGPGTGKTEFLARRVAHLIGTGVPATSILVLTFSRRAAAELERRIRMHLDRPVSGATASTFHSFAHRLLERHRHRNGQPSPSLLTGPEQVRVVSDLLVQEDPDDWPVTFRPLLTTGTFAAEVADFMMRCHERLLEPDDLVRIAGERADWRTLPGFQARYRSRLSDLGKVDYGTLLAEAVNLSGDTALTEQFSHVVVDEYQDTSPAQARLAQLVAGEPANLTVAADPHQSIYSFRGADVANVAAFPKAMSERGRPVTTIILARSHRVPAAILASAGRLVAPNRLEGLPSMELIPADHSGEVEAYTFDQRSAEAEWIASEVERLAVSENVPLHSMAVLVRSTRHLLPELSRALDRRHIPHDRPDARLIDHPAIRMIVDVVASALAPPRSMERALAVRRLLLGPLVGLSLARERQVARAAARSTGSWADLLRSEVPEASPLPELMSDSAWATEVPAVDGFWHLWDRLPGLDSLVTDPRRADYRSAWSTFARMLERQAERDPGVCLAETLDATSAGDFEATPLLSFTRPDEDRLAVTTLHQAKGLEFEVVFIADAIEGVFPDTRRARALLQTHHLTSPAASDGPSVARSRLEEERRLAYTATTRARRRVVWTATTAGIDEGERRPSRFILAAAGLDSFEQVGPPPIADRPGFQPLTLSEAESSLRRMTMDPAVSTVERLASLYLLATGSRWDPLSFSGVPEPGPDHGVVDGPIRLSPSQAGLYDECPRKYALERRLHTVDTESPYLAFGSIVHEALELAEKEAVEAGSSRGNPARALIHLDAVWEQYPPFGPPPLDEAWKRRARELIDQLYAEWPGSDSAPIALEVELNMTLDGTEWVGRADRVEAAEGGVKVVDYKTSKNPPTLKDAARSLQLGYYLLAAAEHPRLREHGPPVAAELWFPLANRARKVYPFDIGNLQDVRDSLAAVSEGIRSEDWTPRVGRHCERCPFKPVCPAWPDGRDAYR